MAEVRPAIGDAADRGLSMCTVTLVPGRSGYRLGMNRDEQRTRPVGLPPARHRYPSGVTVICPSEPTGGTWISLNDCGVSLALVNWYSVPARVVAASVSRGEVVRQLAAIRDARELKRGIRELPLDRINPFRLIAIFLASHEIVECRWNLSMLRRLDLPWQAQQWISSGFDEPTAQRVRGEVFRAECSASDFDSTSWLRRLHASHLPEAGPFSTCMHREDAVTVSYTEIVVSSRGAVMRHKSGSPCDTRERGGATIVSRDFKSFQMVTKKQGKTSIP
jgi:hypothetical protein